MITMRPAKGGESPSPISFQEMNFDDAAITDAPSSKLEMGLAACRCLYGYMAMRLGVVLSHMPAEFITVAAVSARLPRNWRGHDECVQLSAMRRDGLRCLMSPTFQRLRLVVVTALAFHGCCRPVKLFHDIIMAEITGSEQPRVVSVCSCKNQIHLVEFVWYKGHGSPKGESWNHCRV